MEDTLKEYLKSVNETAKKYKEEELQIKEYLQSMNEIESWLKEQCDENSHNRKIRE